MSFDWTHSFCLTCDKQTDGTTYCSQSCRLADYEKTSTAPGSEASSPSWPSSQPWTESSPTTTRTTSNNRFYLSPAFDFSNPRAYILENQTPTTSTSESSSHSAAGRTLSPSSSHSSLSSMKSSSPSAAQERTQQLSEKARRELLAYASSFESVRLQRRRSY